MNASVGDDVFGEDPTVNLFEERIAELSGMAAAVLHRLGLRVIYWGYWLTVVVVMNTLWGNLHIPTCGRVAVRQ